jgi:hypothetical protein
MADKSEKFSLSIFLNISSAIGHRLDLLGKKGLKSSRQQISYLVFEEIGYITLPFFPAI